MTIIYLDYNSTNPVAAEVVDVMVHYLREDFGNAGSRTHQFGQNAKNAVLHSRQTLASLLGVKTEELIFTSGATESNNLATLGLEEFGALSGKTHIVSTSIEHKSILEPLEYLSKRNFDIELVGPQPDGRIDAQELLARVRPDTLLVSVMGVNNETGAVQPINQIAEGLRNSEAYLHVDASQAFIKEKQTYANKRIDFITVSAHKIGGPKGIGALATRRRKYSRPPLQPRQFGGGQEWGIRPGTLPVPLIAGFAKAAELSNQNLEKKLLRARALNNELVKELTELGALFNNDPLNSVPTTVNFSIPNLDSEAALMALRSVAAASNGSACTSQSYEPSHVLTAAGLPNLQIGGAVRISWGLETESLPISEMIEALARFRN